MAICPGHRDDEEADFFPVVTRYLDDEEMEAVLVEVAGRDRAMIHEKYGRLAAGLTARTEDWELRDWCFQDRWWAALVDRVSMADERDA